MATTTPRRTERDVTLQEDIITSSAARKTLAVGRIIIGWVFLWAFIDKLFGLGYMTPAERAWINGGTPAQGFIKGIEGPFSGLFQVFVNPFGDALFMAGLLGIGVAMMTGAGLKIAAVTGSLLMLFMYMAELPLALGGTNPITDSHWVEAMLLIISAVTLSGDTWGLGKWWAGKVGNSWLR
ncbi:thiosulfate dehydrogenase [quinone] large subunit [Georgenia soli]|uniref:Thiosulfate dehydrogenase [quinone] large subunit n=1 Tax=Georgenia soli TaxID=638953 RepID=A0A2A9ENV7_9MICO|nr:DoxX family protein [Georgenia soli]PFG40777.1 thiosulfate dehydrogenase [quinone] large subunit [Georgenia soli]